MRTLAPPHISAIHRHVKTKPPRSRLGLIALLSSLVLAAWVGFGPSTARLRPADGPLSYSGYASSTRVAAAPRTKRIADVRVGERVKADNPTGERDLALGELVDPPTWRKLILRAPKRDGGWADVELLRPLAWMHEHGAHVGGRVRISVPECGINGDADVLDILPCPTIATGAGRVVTGTFRHSSSHVVDLRVEGLPLPIVTTVNHLFWSSDRGQFVRADDLHPGEHLSGDAGQVAVLSISQRRDRIPVYNLEVHVEHVYHVSQSGIVVHNGDPTECLKRIGGAAPAADLGSQAAAAEAKLGVHGVSVTGRNLKPGVPFGSAPRGEVEKSFNVVDTPSRRDPSHRTVELPKPVTDAIADLFNSIFFPKQ